MQQTFERLMVLNMKCNSFDSMQFKYYFVDQPNWIVPFLAANVLTWLSKWASERNLIKKPFTSTLEAFARALAFSQWLKIDVLDMPNSINKLLVTHII